ncbi:Helix-turn-helix domain-containing protein [Gracilibacillus orientalis]|uniref:Helix-turn-helix domain-containing protein n=1 Tax=Gracilibacillus orientalis TaxID=334253 RepID=A0A1I4PLU3_9BACI|nr:helix-turn-helix transcriptional regulator [Gracilibacillus orientalis]SFM28576.1 Helix-turn-helix domain-containing protein [Gracilibacillus orientalis]
MNELGELLKELRGKKSLREVAKDTGLSHSYISDIEKGFRRDTKTPLKPSPETLKRLSDSYDYPYESLLEKAGYIDKKPESESVEGFFGYDLDSLTEEEKKELKDQLKKEVEFFLWQKNNKKKP